MYESDADRSRQEEVISKLSARYGWAVRRLPLRYVVDYLATKEGQLVACVEIKYRNIKFGTYPSYMLSAYKHKMGNEWAREFGGAWVLAVSFDGDIRIAPLTNKIFPVGWGGRRDRNDSQDEEPVVHIPLELFQRIGGIDA